MDTDHSLAPSDRLEIEQTHFDGFWLIDTGRASEVADLFTEDGSITFGPGSPNPGTVAGAALRETLMARQKQTQIATRHVLTNVRLQSDATDHVTLQSILTLFRGDAPNISTTPIGIADITEKYLKTSGGWKISSREVMPIPS